MSEHPTGDPGIQEPENIQMGRSVAILIGSLLAFAAVVVWATIIMQNTAREVLPNGWLPPPEQVGRAEIGMVNQKMFELDQRVERRTERLREELNGYGWVDPKHGVVHVPIDKAIDAYLAEQPQ
nr:hypothetical protein Hi04_10k_c5202_00010 [uncultured bacterium]